MILAEWCQNNFKYFSPSNSWLKVHPDGKLTGIDGILLEELARRTGIKYLFEKSKNSFVGMTDAVIIFFLVF